MGRLVAPTAAAPGEELPSCSVVVPVRDDAMQLRGLLACLAAQSQRPLEVIVVDNAFDDATAAVALAAGCTVLFEPRQGIAPAAHRGYDAARGELILRCDADSRPPPGWVRAHARAHAHAKPGTAAVTGPGWFQGLPIVGALLTIAYVGAYVVSAGAALGHPPLFGTTMSLRREWWHRVRSDASRSPRVHDDMDLSFLIGSDERVVFSASVGVRMSLRSLRWGRPGFDRWRLRLGQLKRAVGAGREGAVREGLGE